MSESTYLVVPRVCDGHSSAECGNDCRIAALAAALRDLDREEKLILRREVEVFAQMMERQLRENDHKNGWSECSNDELKDRLLEEMVELSRELRSPTAMSIGDEAADVANFAMMLADNNKELCMPGFCHSDPELEERRQDAEKNRR